MATAFMRLLLETANVSSKMEDARDVESGYRSTRKVSKCDFNQETLRREKKNLAVNEASESCLKS